MQKSINPDNGISGDMFGFRPFQACSQRQIQSPADPATFESYVELMRQGAAGSARVAAAARILQREAHRTSLTAKAAMGALYKAGEDPFRLINIQFDRKKGPVEAEGDRVQLSLRKSKEFKGEYTGGGVEKHDAALEAKKAMKKKSSMLKALKEKAKLAAKKAKEFAKKNKRNLAIAGAVTAVAGTASAVNQATKKAALLADLGADCDTAVIATGLVVANTRSLLAQRAAAAFISSKALRPPRSRGSRSYSDFL